MRPRAVQARVVGGALLAGALALTFAPVLQRFQGPFIAPFISEEKQVADFVDHSAPKSAVPPPMTARPFTMPTAPPDVRKERYSLRRSMYWSATCCSSERAIDFALRTCAVVTTGAFSSVATSPATRMRPPSSRRRSVRRPRRPARRCASWMTTATDERSKCGILPSRLTS